MAEEFGPYLLGEVIGRGGMGVVHRAFDTRRDRTVALKRLPRELAEDENFQARFRRESRLAARLNEPHIIPIHDFGEIEGQLYIDMRLVEGLDLSKLIAAEGGALEPGLAVDIIGQVAAALAAAHTAGLMHRDIKPSNVLVTGITDEDRSSPFAYLVDFGIARAILGSEGTALTTTTDWFGTVAYMAPERISGASGDSRSDIYSLACLLYQCLVGQAPFTGEALQVLFAHVNSAPPSATAGRATVPPGLDAVIRRGMAKNPDDRYQTAAQFAAAARSSVTGARGRAGEQTQVVPLATRPIISDPRSGGPPTSNPPGSGSPHGGPRPAGPPYSGPHSAGPPHSIPPRPIHTSGPMPPRPRHRPPNRSGNNRALVIMIAIAIITVLAAVIAVIVAVRGGNNASALGSSPNPTATASLSTPPTSPTSAGTSSSPSLSSSATTTPSIAGWSNFRDFTQWVGTSPGSTATSYLGATCALKGPDSIDGMIDQIECKNLIGSKVIFYVGRFASKVAVNAYLAGLVKDKYRKRYWTIAAKRRGLVLTSPTTDRFADVTSSICALPLYLVQFYSPAGNALTGAQVQDRFWKKSVFPDTVPAVCG